MEDKEKINEAMFMQLVMQIQGLAWIMLGKVMNPMTQKIEKNMDAAKAAIDTLMMLQAKTKGNLSKTEDEFLKGMLQQLEINFVDESNKPVEAEKQSDVDKKEDSSDKGDADKKEDKSDEKDKQE